MFSGRGRVVLVKGVSTAGRYQSHKIHMAHKHLTMANMARSRIFRFLDLIFAAFLRVSHHMRHIQHRVRMG